jgi:hypothetical protein
MEIKKIYIFFILINRIIWTNLCLSQLKKRFYWRGCLGKFERSSTNLTGPEVNDYVNFQWLS